MNRQPQDTIVNTEEFPVVYGFESALHCSIAFAQKRRSLPRCPDAIPLCHHCEYPQRLKCHCHRQGFARAQHPFDRVVNRFGTLGEVRLGDGQADSSADKISAHFLNHLDQVDWASHQDNG